MRNSILTRPEPRALAGETRVQYEDGSSEAFEPSILPETAVCNNRVVVYVDGIRYMKSSQQADIRTLFHGAADDTSLLHVDQPVVAVHEGVGRGLSDPERIVQDFAILKLLQGGKQDPGLIQTLYDLDPAVRSLHDVVQQSLEAGHDVLLAAHSGGGTETAAALTVLANEDGGRYQAAIRDHVRLLQIAPAASMPDFLLAGVRQENLYYTDSQNDPAYGAFHTFVPPEHPKQALSNAVESLLDVTPRALQRHSPYYIFAHNGSGGASSIQAFVDGAPNGGDHSFLD
jgi:hypothetical protein